MKYNEANGQPNRIEKGTKITGEIQSESDFRIDGINTLRYKLLEEVSLDKNINKILVEL